MNNNREIVEVVKEELNHMLVKYRVLALFWYYERFNTKEISSILEIPEEIVDIRINKVENLIQTKIYKIEKIAKSQIPEIVSTAFEMIFKDYELSEDIANKMRKNIMENCLPQKVMN